jgi:hypothetical protein
MHIRSIMAGIQQASPGMAMGVEPSIEEYMVSDDIFITMDGVDGVAALTSDVITFLHRRMGQVLDYLAVNIEGIRYGLVGKGTVVDGPMIDDFSKKFAHFLQLEITRENNGNGQTED